MIDTPGDEVLLLELLNTTPVVRGERTDALRADDEAIAWIRARGGVGNPVEAANVRTARVVLQSVVRGEQNPAVLASFLSGAAMVPSVHSGAVTWQLQAAPDDLLVVRAVIGWGVLQPTGRLRSCGNVDCHRFLIDRSHANRAQWCSMAVCGNRMKARRHYQRTRGASPS